MAIALLGNTIPTGAILVVPDVVKRTALQAANSALTANKNNAFASAAMVAA